MTWAEALAVFNFIAWLLPLIIRTWMAVKYDSSSEHTLSTEESERIGSVIKRINLGGKRLKIGHDSEGIGLDKNRGQGNALQDREGTNK